MKDYFAILNHYREDILDDNMLDEAIATCEQFFGYMDGEELLHHSRPLAIAYLALKIQKDNADAEYRNATLDARDKNDKNCIA